MCAQGRQSGECHRFLQFHHHLVTAAQLTIEAHTCIIAQFYQHLLEAMQELKHGYTTEFLRVSSYHGTESTGVVNITGSGLDFAALKNRHVILVEDIVDTGTTLSKVMPTIQKEVPSLKSLQVCSLLEKRLEQPPKVAAKYIGFRIPNHFIIGYGLDYNELYRDLRDIWVISKQGIDFDQASLYE